MTRIKDGAIIKWIQSILIDKTVAEKRVYAWKKSSSRSDKVPFVNITTDAADLAMADDAGRGAATADRRLAVILTAEGVEDDQQDSSNRWVIDVLDDFEKEVLDLIWFDYMPLGAPKGLKTLSFISARTVREDKESNFAVRYLIFSVKTKDVPSKR